LRTLRQARCERSGFAAKVGATPTDTVWPCHPSLTSWPKPRNIIVAGVKRDGRPHLSPNLFYWDGERFFISTTRDRVKYKIFRRDPRVELIVDDATGHRYVRVSGTVEVLEDIPSNLPMDRAIREKHGIPVAPDEELAASLVADNRVLLAVTPARPVSEWSVLGVEA